MRKGQGALEYLMTYGWALLIIVVVGAALYGLGVLNPGTYAKAACSGFTYFNHRDHKMTTDGNFSMWLNNGAYTADFTNISIRKSGGLWSNGDARGGVSGLENATGPDANIAPNSIHTVWIYEPMFGGQENGPYSYEIRIKFLTDDGVSHEDIATCSGKYESA